MGFTVTESILTKIPSVKTHIGNRIYIPTCFALTDQTEALWSKKQPRRNNFKAKKTLVWHDLLASYFKIRQLYRILVNNIYYCKQISGGAPDGAGGGSSKEILTKWGSSEVSAAIMVCRERPVPSPGLRRSSWKGLTWRPGVGPGRRQEEREAEAAAQPERRHGRAGPRNQPPQGCCPAPRGWELSLCAPLCLPFPWSGGFIDSSTWLSPDRKRACVSGCDSPVNKENPALGKQTHSTHGAVEALTPAARLPPRRKKGAHLTWAEGVVQRPQPRYPSGGMCRIPWALLLSQGDPGQNSEVASSLPLPHTGRPSLRSANSEINPQLWSALVWKTSGKTGQSNRHNRVPFTLQPRLNLSLNYSSPTPAYPLWWHLILCLTITWLGQSSSPGSPSPLDHQA